MRIRALIIPATLFLPSLNCSSTAQEPEPELTPLSVFTDAFNNHQSNIQVMQKGTIIAVLSDDTVGDRHQRMIIRLGNDQTLLIAHNIDLAPRIPPPQKGHNLKFFGEYEWNDEGGVIHWTHADPAGKHVDGWLEYEGTRYGGSAASAASVPQGCSFTRAVGRGGVSLLNAAEVVFDIQGRFQGQALGRRAPGIYLLQSADGMGGYLKFFH